jgi:ubiquinone/menaquinone biosynthesis C-methylase UbiE
LLPRIIDTVMRSKATARLRAEWIPQARGTVLEVGIGSGLNFPFYSSNVTRVFGVDPSSELQVMARKNARRVSFPVEFLTQSAEQRLSLEPDCIDTVVVTFTLCSIGDPILALRNVGSVMKPEGRLIFLEHGRAPDAGVAAWQDRLTPIWSRVGGGCRLNRPIDRLIRDAGFEIARVSTGYLPGPRPMTFTYRGLARLQRAI